MNANTPLLSRLRQSRFAVWACATAALGFIVAVAIPQPRRLRIAIHQGIEGVALKMAANEFADKKHVQVTIDDLPYDRLYELELRELHQLESDYDVFMVDDPWMPALAAAEEGKFHLAPVQLTDEDCGPQGFVPSTLLVARNVTETYSTAELSCSHDTFYGVPYVGNSQLFVRKKSRSEPEDWKSLLKDSGYFLRSGPGNPIVTDFMPMLWAASVNSFQSDTTRGIEVLPDAVPALEALMGLGAQERSNLSITSFDDLDLAIHMVRGTATASIAWSAWAMAMDSRARDQLEFSQLPKGMSPELGVWLLAIPANSSRRGRAQEFLSYVTTEEALVTAARYGNPPPRKSVFENPEYRKVVPIHDEQLESLSNARPRPRAKSWRQVEAVLGRCLSTIYESPKADAKLVLKAANAAIKKVLALPNETTRNTFVDGFRCQVDSGI